MKLVNLENAKMLATVVAPKKILVRVIQYFTMIEQLFWASENNPLDSSVYAATRTTKRKLDQDVEEYLKENNCKRSRHDEVRDKVSSILSGSTEVACVAGRCDVMTKTYAIEVKYYNHWKYALGQALAYGISADKKAVICLFGGILDNIGKAACKQAGVLVWYMDDKNKLIQSIET